MHAHCFPATPRARRWLTGALVVSGLAFAGASVNAADAPAVKPPAATAEPAFDPQAEATLKAMSEFLRHQPVLTVTGERVQEGVTYDQEKIQIISQLAVQVQRPGKFRAEVSTGKKKTTWCGVDGRIVGLREPENRLTEIKELPATIDGMADALAKRYHFSLALADLVADDPMASFKQGTLSGRCLGQVMLDGVPCLHLAYRAKNLDWQLWITADKTPLPKRFVITYRHQPKAPQLTFANLRWTFPATLPPETFALTPPAGATIVELKPSAVQPPPPAKP
jgi:hypothetical protein